MSEQSSCLVSYIVAVADNGVIGRGGRLPWRLKSDLRRFRQLTMGHPLIMGRKTFDSIGRPLDGRASIVLSRSGAVKMQAGPNASAPDSVLYVASWPQALEVAAAWAQSHGVHEIFVIGGVSLFEAALHECGRIYLTRVHGAPEGDVSWMAPSAGDEWREISRAERAAGPEDEFPVTDILLGRVSKSGL